MEIKISKNCGNSPKMQRIIELNKYYAESNIKKILSFFADDIQWHIGEDVLLIGIKDVSSYLTNKLQGKNARGLTLEYVLSHGKLAAANGKITYENEPILFSDFYEFTSASSSSKIKRITSSSR